MNPRPRQRLLFFLGSVAVAIALLLGIEGAWRIAGRIRSGKWPLTRAEAHTRLVESLGKAYRPHPFYLVGGRPGASFEALGHRISFTPLGHRGPQVVDPKPPGRYRVLCLGGSATFDLLAPDDSTTWPARAGRLLQGENVDVVNAGFPGWTTVESLISLELRDIDLEPDLVIVYAGLNDLQPGTHRPFARDYSLGHGELLPRVLGVEPVPLGLASRLVFIEWLLDRMGAGKTLSEGFAPSWKWTGGERKPVIPEAAAEVFERNLRSTVAVARARGARVLLIPQRVFPSPGNPDDFDYLESWAPGLVGTGFVPSLQILAGVEHKLAREGLVELVDPFEKTHFSRSDFGDPMHFNVQGSEKFAGEVAAAVRAARRAPGNVE